MNLFEMYKARAKSSDCSRHISFQPNRIAYTVNAHVQSAPMEETILVHEDGQVKEQFYTQDGGKSPCEKTGVEAVRSFDQKSGLNVLKKMTITDL